MLSVPRSALIICVLACSQLIAAEPAKKHPADAYLEICLNDESTTAGMLNCVSRTYALWDQELNVKYVDLLGTLAPEQKTVFRNAQRQWLVYRDQEFKAIDAIYAKMDGTLYLQLRAIDKMEIVKSRVEQINSYINVLKE